MRELDELLTAPLPPIADGHFSARVMRAIAWEKLRRQGATAALVFACLLPVVLALPLQQIGMTLGTLLPHLAASTAVQIAAAAVVLTVIADRVYSRS
jgi:hypothetical protein